jgi:cytochrome bd-type quinol oxidase subunit 2
VTDARAAKHNRRLQCCALPGVPALLESGRGVEAVWQLLREEPLLGGIIVASVFAFILAAVFRMRTRGELGKGQRRIDAPLSLCIISGAGSAAGVIAAVLDQAVFAIAISAAWMVLVFAWPLIKKSRSSGD